MRKLAWIIAASLVLTASVTACGPKEKPAELIELERVRSSTEAAQINVQAPSAYARSTELYNSAVDAWTSGEKARASSYASLGQRQYATAKAISATKEANSKVLLYKKEIETNKAAIKTLEVQRDGLEKSIALMKHNISAASLASVETKIQSAMTERERAAGVGAKETQADTFNAGDLALKQATEYMAVGNRDAAGKAAEEANALFIRAYEAAKPEFDRQQQNLKSAERQTSLMQDAQAAVGPSYVFMDMKGVVMVVAGAFDYDKTTLLPIKYDVIHNIGELAKKYPETTVIIEGYTQERSRKAFEVSQMRADGVRDMLIPKGVDSRRLMTTAKGKENQRYNNRNKSERGLNDRVEITFIFP
ncbi:MAG: OmpA family protein [Bradymonadales bacterium]|jgi:outer membrane protein OmpA-like peptidoglycan-associated protein